MDSVVLEFLKSNRAATKQRGKRLNAADCKSVAFGFWKPERGQGGYCVKPLSRAFARLVLLFFALGIFFLAVNELIPYRTLGDRYRVMDTAYWIKNTLRITGIVLLVNGGIQWV